MLTVNMFEEFSSGYYLGRLYVEPDDTDDAVIHDVEYQELHRGIYHGDTDDPLVFKLDNHHIPVRGSNGVPSATLALPHEVAESIDLDNPPSIKNVLLAKQRYAERVLNYFRGPPST